MFGENIDLIGFLEQTCVDLNQIDNALLFNHQGTKFEKILHESLIRTKKRLSIQNIIKIELVSGKKFPDIILHTEKSLFGVEVKTSKSIGWETLGGSIFESTKVDGVDVIAVFFANFSGENPAYRYGYMKDCISDIAITHKPRYVINMDTNPGETVFDKTGTTYDLLANSSNPFSLVRKYMKEKSGDLWWIDNDESEAYDYKNNIQGIRAWNELSESEEQTLILDISTLFPIIFSQKKNYNEISTYLVTKKGIVNPSLRDKFSAGGKFIEKGFTLPKYFKRLFDEQFVGALISRLDNPNIKEVIEYWGDIDISKYKERWLDRVIKHVRSHDEDALSPEKQEFIIRRLKIFFKVVGD